MAILKEFKFSSVNKFNDEIDKIEFTSKGYIDDKVIYFKNDGVSYKILLEDTLKVMVNDSRYEFDVNKKTLAHIRTTDFSLQASVTTDKLNISNNKIEIAYRMDFTSFVGEYNIIVEWN